MWVRTQSRKGLIDAICFTTSSCRIYADAIGFEDYVLGTYATESRTLEVLDEIQAHIIGKLIIPQSTIFPFVNGEQIEITTHSDIEQLACVYEMPKE